MVCQIDEPAHEDGVDDRGTAVLDRDVESADRRGKLAAGRTERMKGAKTSAQFAGVKRRSIHSVRMVMDSADSCS